MLTPDLWHDDRGLFCELWNANTLDKKGCRAKFLQGNLSRSGKNVIRGLHYQIGSHRQAKLVWVSVGKIFDVIVDLRRESPSFGRWFGCVLDSESRLQLWVPEGCAHGFLAMTDIAEVCYNVTAPYHPESEQSLKWDDPQIGIEWPLEKGVAPILSLKDQAACSFAACHKF